MPKSSWTDCNDYPSSFVLVYRFNFLAMPFVFALAICLLTVDTVSAFTWSSPSAMITLGCIGLHVLLSIVVLFFHKARTSHLGALAGATLLALGGYWTVSSTCLIMGLIAVAFIAYPMNAAELFRIAVVLSKQREVLGCGEHHDEAPLAMTRTRTARVGPAQTLAFATFTFLLAGAAIGCSIQYTLPRMFPQDQLVGLHQYPGPIGVNR